MKIDEDGENITLETTGRTFYANNNILGIDGDGNVSQGCDGSVSIIGDFTSEEREEIANDMIMRWARWGMKQ